MNVKGSCLCGGVTYSFDRDAVKWCSNCLCSLCRRANSAGMVAWVGLKTRAALQVSDLRVLLKRYDSSPNGTRSFCSTCGSQLFFEGKRWPDEIHVTLASVHEPHDLAPTANAFFDDRAKWVLVNDGLPRRGGPTGTEPL